MAESGCEIVFLSGRLGGRDEVRGLRALIDRLAMRGHVSKVICASARPDHGIADLAECPGLARRWQAAWVARGIGPFEESDRPRILHVLNASMADAGLELAERHRLPYLLTIDEFPVPEGRIRMSRAWCRGLIATNPELAACLTRDFKVPARSIELLARGVDAPDRLERARSPGRVPVVGASGTLVTASGFSTFLNAAKKVVDAGVDAEFLISGEGEEEGDLRRKADRLGIADRLTFADELAVGLTFWDVLDVFCQTSLFPTVGRPLVLALAHGVPSIASDVAGLRTFVEDGRTGVLVPHGDASALSKAILGLLRDPDRARSLGEAGRDAILLDHRPDQEADRLDAIYRDVAARGLGPQDSGLGIGWNRPTDRAPLDAPTRLPSEP